MPIEKTSPGTESGHPRYFADTQALRAWLGEHHGAVDELWVGLYKRGTGRRSITWPELVDQLLCFGWIDGVRKSLGEESYAIRVTPRRLGSTWSAVNLKRVVELGALGLMEPAGLAAYEARDEARARQYSFERERVSLGEYEAEFRRQREAWAYFQAQPPSYRRTATWWVMSAKREETRRRRLDTLIRDSVVGLRIGPLRR